jgi:hypothetical protein
MLLLVKFQTKIVHDYQNKTIFLQQPPNQNQQKTVLMYFSLECFKTHCFWDTNIKMLYFSILLHYFITLYTSCTTESSKYCATNHI